MQAPGVRIYDHEGDANIINYCGEWYEHTPKN